MMDQEAVFVRPTREVVILFWKWVAIVLSVFLTTYFFANQLAAQSSKHYGMYTDWELNIPMVSWMIVIYVSYVAVFLLVPMVMKSGQAIADLARAFLAATLISTIVFVLFPGELGYHRPEYVSDFDFLYQLLYQLDRPHNLYPSLHVTFSSLTAMAMVHQTKARWFHIIIIAWAVLLAASVILVHQHHLFDVLTGFLLAGFCYKYVYLRSVSLKFLTLES